MAIDGALGAALAVPLVAAGGVAAWKFATYSQLEFITAAMLTNQVPKNKPTVIQLQGGTRELFYYPKSLLQVTVVGESMNKSLIEQAGLQAAIPTLCKPQSPTNLGFAADASVDAVVSLGALAGMGEAQRTAFAAEALRVLKPGCPIIFLEKIPGGLPFRFLGSSDKTISPSYLEGWKALSGQFELVTWDVALEGQDPHAVGVAVKAENARPLVVPTSPREKAAEKAERERSEREARKERERAAKAKKKGFEKSGASS
ncbi:hypothetical protein HYH03_015292 [Edaphochlamys debaryana]|uniref:Methyltransferase type 11 domain-containing protein n=1 Tax=Edaphochlamys debaryana TaxID=47281 RepID=A0A836BR09_9CHLO|nr:hypothetical protein HYH03_015292 [Edaphochlamys debaryana]|eukprot:KAG2485966.1 hypothetical protein HYH03_015292 [Edaphochlamys debaryana]